MVIKSIEGSLTGVGPAVNNLYHGMRQGHQISIAESSFELAGGITTCAYYAGKFLNILPLITSVFTEHVPYIISVIGHSDLLMGFLGYIGIINSFFRGTKETFSLCRQNLFLDLFEKHAWKGANIRNALAETIENFDKPGFQEALPQKFKEIVTGKKHLLEKLLKKIDNGDQKAVEKIKRVFARWKGRDIRDKLITMTNLLDVELERALPNWLYGDIINQGGKNYLCNLFQKLDKGDLKAIDEATKLVDTMQSYARKKTTVHILRIIGAVIGIISFIGFFVTWPWAVTVLFLVLTGTVATAAYMYNSGYLENREDGFSLKLCVPEFIRNMAFDLGNFPEIFRAWINAKKPKVLTPDPFFEKRIEIAQPKTTSFSAERLQRRIRLAARGILLSGSAAA